MQRVVANFHLQVIQSQQEGYGCKASESVQIGRIFIEQFHNGALHASWKLQHFLMRFINSQVHLTAGEDVY